MASIYNPPVLVALPTDVLRAILNHLDPQELLLLSGVCKLLRILSLVVLFTTHRHQYEAIGERIVLSSSSVDELEANLRSVTKVACRADEVSSHLVALLGSFDLQELDVELPAAKNDKKRSLAKLLVASFVRKQRWYPSPTVLLIRNEAVMISEQKRRAPWSISIYSVNSKSLLQFLRRVAIYLLAAVAKKPLEFLLDPFAARDQRGRILRDVSALCKMDEYSTIHLESLPSFSSVRNWNLVTFDTANLQLLFIGHLMSAHRWRLLLPHLHLPALRILTICKDVVLPISELFTFCSRHTKLELLSLEHYSLSFDVVVDQDGDSRFPSLIALEAPLHYFDHLLPFIDITRLEEVSIGKHPYNKFRHQPRRYFQHDRLEKPFNFDTLDTVLQTLSPGSIDRLLVLVLPGGSKSKEWLMKCGREGRVGPQLPQVRNLTIRSEFDKGFDPVVIQLFANLLALCPAMRTFQFRPIRYPLHAESYDVPLPSTINQYAGTHSNEERMIVDIFSRLRCARCGHHDSVFGKAEW